MHDPPAAAPPPVESRAPERDGRLFFAASDPCPQTFHLHGASKVGPDVSRDLVERDGLALPIVLCCQFHRPGDLVEPTYEGSERIAEGHVVSPRVEQLQGP